MITARDKSLQNSDTPIIDLDNRTWDRITDLIERVDATLTSLAPLICKRYELENEDNRPFNPPR